MSSSYKWTVILQKDKKEYLSTILHFLHDGNTVCGKKTVLCLTAKLKINSMLANLNRAKIVPHMHKIFNRLCTVHVIYIIEAFLIYVFHGFVLTEPKRTHIHCMYKCACVIYHDSVICVITPFTLCKRDFFIHCTLYLDLCRIMNSTASIE